MDTSHADVVQWTISMLVSSTLHGCDPGGKNPAARRDQRCLPKGTMNQTEGRSCIWTPLMRAANAGDEGAYRRVLEGIAPILRAQIHRRLARTGSGVDDVEDILQETFLALHLKRHSWRHDEPFTPWIRAIANHKLIDALRRRGRCINLPIDGFEATLAVQEDEPPLLPEQARRMLIMIPGRRREVVEAIFFGGLTVQEAASRLGISESAVRVALHRGISALSIAFRKRAQRRPTVSSI